MAVMPCYAVAGAQATEARDRSQAEQLVVMLRLVIGGDEAIGAGIIVGIANDRLYIVTANHVVRRGPDTASSLRVELRNRPGEFVRAALTGRFDARADVAVLVVSGAKSLGLDSSVIAFDRLGDLSTLARGDGVHALGNPQGRPWTTNVSPLPISSASDTLITFEAATVAEGHSGGALLDQRASIVGLLLNVSPPVATARNITQVLDLVRGWRFPVALTTRFDAGLVKPVAVGESFTCAAMKDGAAFCWGRNEAGELGNGGRVNSASPVRVATTTRFASVAAGWSAACGLSFTGTVSCWGNPKWTPSVAPDSGAAVAFTALSIGTGHACAVTRRGAVYCWGGNDRGQFGDGTTDRSAQPVRVRSAVRFRSVSAGAHHSCALGVDGRAYCWGSGESGKLGNGNDSAQMRPVEVAGGIRFSTISAGYSHTCGVADTGRGYCWGDNRLGQLGDGKPDKNGSTSTPREVIGGHRFTSIDASNHGLEVACGLTRGGEAYCWGNEVGRNNGTPTRAGGNLKFRAIAAAKHVCGMLENADVYCWGYNDFGQLGDGSTTSRTTPALVPIIR